MELTAQQLIQYNGTDPSKPIYVALKGRVFDVTDGKSFYGPGGPYAMFAGKDASRALAKMTKNEEDITASLDGLSEKEIGVLTDWEKKFEAKYPVVGRFDPVVHMCIVVLFTEIPNFDVPRHQGLPVLVQQLQQLVHETYADFDFSASLSSLVLFLTLPKSGAVIKVHQKTDFASPIENVDNYKFWPLNWSYQFIFADPFFFGFL
ncbi:PREDICTED: membrane [Prunus dulcis]|uniref:PREDICTED: membrane n=1 Tax=Prunus dulcis TaxID=3755 RepID=A0A5E4E7G9_PRUDU|nr:hypothetical protein L3X38_006945 [Prunus dulcis]VVA11635.1 PREDICTED: membrane [Prunus dulcis]